MNRLNRFTAAIAIAIVLASGVGVAAVRSTALARLQPTTEENCQTVELVEEGDSGIQGTGQLCVNETGVRATIGVQELTPGEVYTVWFVYFDNPSACSAAPCAPPDVQGDDPLGVLARMDGLIADETGTAEFSGLFRDLRLSAGSEVHLGIFAHGPADPNDGRMLARQLLTPQVPALGAPGLGAVADGAVGHPVAAAIFMIPNGEA